MIVTDKLKQIVFKQLYKELGNAEIIPYSNSMWLIDREKEFWYFELDKSGTLWWRYLFFTSFFEMFSMTANDFTPILSSWVEEVLNHKVTATKGRFLFLRWRVEEVLNHKVTATDSVTWQYFENLEEVLNHKVSETKRDSSIDYVNVEEILNQ